MSLFDAHPEIRWGINFLAVLGISAGSVGWYARRAYYVSLAGNQVAIYKGRPGGIL